MNKDHWFGVLILIGGLGFIFLSAIVYTFAQHLMGTYVCGV